MTIISKQIIANLCIEYRGALELFVCIDLKLGSFNNAAHVQHRVWTAEYIFLLNMVQLCKHENKQGQTIQQPAMKDDLDFIPAIQNGRKA